MKGRSTAKNHKEYLSELEEPRKSALKTLDKLIRGAAPSFKPYMQSGMMGYGEYHYKYASGREGDWFRIGMASQKNYISLYFCICDGETYLAEKFKKELPKASIGKSCVRFKKIEDVDLKVIEKMVKRAVKLSKTAKN